MNVRKRLIAVAALVVVLALGACGKNSPAASTGGGSPGASQPAGALDLSSERAQLSSIDSDLNELNGDLSSTDAGINSTSEGDVSR